VLTHPLSLVLIAFVVTAIPAFLDDEDYRKHLESLYIIGSALLIGGIVMWLWMRGTRGGGVGKKGEGAAYSHVAYGGYEFAAGGWIVACQILSRCFRGLRGRCRRLRAGQLAGMSRASALEFSFFLSIPTMVVATCYDLLKSGSGETMGTGFRFAY